MSDFTMSDIVHILECSQSGCFGSGSDEKPERVLCLSVYGAGCSVVVWSGRENQQKIKKLNFLDNLDKNNYICKK